jgi:threonine aldolase
MQGPGAKISAETLKWHISRLQSGGEHKSKPSVLSLSNVTELGCIYTPSEVKQLAQIAQDAGMKVHMDGARFANALVAAGCSPAELTWKAGVDAISFGGTKNGGMIVEIVVFFDTTLAADFHSRRKRGAQHLSKGRYVSAQALAYLKDNVWLANARHANALAKKLSDGLSSFNSIHLPNPTQANEVFAVMPQSTFDRLQAGGAYFYDWPVLGIRDGDVHCRFVLSWNTPEKSVDDLLKLVKQFS